MYHHPGEYVTDFCIVEHDRIFHLFHIRGERWTWQLGYQELDLGHATSTDLRLWTPHEPVMPAGPEGAWDECGNWAPDIIEHEGLFYCYYTGSDRNNNQAIGLATSSDLFTWTKHADNPVVRLGPWSDRAVGKDVAGRDAMVFADRARNRFLLYYTATCTDGRACIACSESTDLIRWRGLGPTYIEEDRSYNRLESAYLVQRDARYYLFYSAKGGPNSKGFPPSDFDHFDIVYQVSDDPTAGWQKPANHDLLTEWTCASEHPTFDGITYMFYVVQEEIEGVWGASVLSDPKRMEWQEDGTVTVREHVPENVELRRVFDDQRDGYDGWIDQGNAWAVEGEGLSITDAAGSTAFINTLWGKDITVEVEIELAADAAGGLLVRTNPSGMAGYRVSLDHRRQAVCLERMIPGRSALLLQERGLVLGPSRWHRLKVVVQGEFIDVYVDEVLQIVRHERTYSEGCFGLHAEGKVRFRAVSASQYVGPETALPDWQHQCQPYHLVRTGRRGADGKH